MSGSTLEQPWRLGHGRSIQLDQSRLMGILNITPDSFSDGGRYNNRDAAVQRVLEMQSEGAEIVDVGGESTRPGADRIGVQEQIDRVAPVIEAIRGASEILVSVDTTHAPVAQAAIEAGANIINDVSAGMEDPAILEVAARESSGLILMHRLVSPEQDQYSTAYENPPCYEDVVQDVRDFLQCRARAARAAGVDPASIVLDPGLGFGKSVDQNWRLIGETSVLIQGEYPHLGAASRKSFLAAICGGTEVPPARRGPASVAASQVQYLGGVRLFRVHDVALHAQGLGLVQGL